jgi:hypothetical protein
MYLQINNSLKKIKSQSCNVASPFTNSINNCYAQFDKDKVETGAYGLALNTKNGSNFTATA